MQDKTDHLDLFQEENLEIIESINENIKVCHLNAFDESKGECCVYVEENLSAKDVIRNIHEKSINHLVQKNKPHFVQDLKRAAELVRDPQGYFEKEHLLISPEGVNSTTIHFEKREDKNNILASVAQFVGNIKSQVTSYSAIAVIEELYMNATLDAPREAIRRGLTPNHCPNQLFLAYNKTHLQISCTDFCGSLDIRGLVKRMNEVYQKGAGEAINIEGEGGAGIGAYILFEHCSTLVVGVKPGEMTKVSGIIPLRLSNRAFSEIKKSIHGFEVQKI